MAAVVAGCLAGVLTWPAMLALAILAGLCRLSARHAGRPMGWAWTGAAGAMSLAMAVHALPGFHNLLLLDAVHTRADALPFSLYANFDKASVGLFLLVWLAPRLASLGELRAALKPIVLGACGTVLVVVGLACGLDMVRFEPVWLGYTPTFLTVNLLFTCVAEEAFFRGLIQERLSRALRHHPGLIGAVPVLLSAMLFGLAHWGGGPAYVAMAALAGFGYALVYAKVRRVEASMAVHFAVNAAHFIGFTYPAMASSPLRLH
ncbi:MAG: CPBP family intramembrane metalloprotease [Aquabacterium sp.]